MSIKFLKIIIIIIKGSHPDDDDDDDGDQVTKMSADKERNKEERERGDTRQGMVKNKREEQKTI